MNTSLKLAFATASLAGLLVACGGTGDVSGPATGDTPSTDTSAPAPSDDATTEAPSDDATPDEPASDTDPAPVVDGDVDCSAAGLELGDGFFLDLTEEAADSAEFILDAALRCDEQLLATAAAESGTELTFGSADPYEFFGLPEGDEPYYEIIARLLGETQPEGFAPRDDEMIWYWPAVATERGFDDAAAWEDLADAGLYTTEQIEAFRESGTGYLGWRLGIADDGTWMFFVAGD